jgi:hypothetical protein
VPMLLHIHWVYLLTGLAFGLIPPRLLINSECRYLPFEELWSRLFERKDDGLRRKRWWKLPLVWIDPVRGYVVGLMLAQAFSAVRKANFLQAQLPVGAMFAAVLLVIWVQTKGRPGERESLSPAGFIAGLMFALMPPVVAAGALIVGFATAGALHRYVAGYIAAAVMVAGAGYVFIGPGTKLLGVVVMMAAPVWMSWLRRGEIVTPTRC